MGQKTLITCNESNDLPWNPKRARTCFACEARKYSWGWGCDLYNVETLSCKFWSDWTDKNSSIGQLALMLRVRRDVRSDFGNLCNKQTKKAIGLASERRIMVGLVLFLKRLMVGLFVKDYQSSLWVRRDLWSDLFYFLVVIQLANTWFKKKKILLHYYTKNIKILWIFP